VVPGGQLKNGLTSYVAGAPTPQVGDWVVLLLESKAELWTPQGLALGWIDLKGNQTSGFVAYRELGGISLVGENGTRMDPQPYRIRALNLEKLWLNLESNLKPLSLPGAGEVKQ